VESLKSIGPSGLLLLDAAGGRTGLRTEVTCVNRGSYFLGIGGKLEWHPVNGSYPLSAMRAPPMTGFRIRTLVVLEKVNLYLLGDRLDPFHALSCPFIPSLLARLGKLSGIEIGWRSRQ
jgi:hypothetical protein